MKGLETIVLNSVFVHIQCHYTIFLAKTGYAYSRTERIIEV